MPQRLDRRNRATTASSHRKYLSKSSETVATRDALFSSHLFLGNSSFQQTNALNLNPDQWLLPETAEYLRNNDKTPTRGQDTHRHQSLNQSEYE